jgi:hypothetical protein
MVDTRKGVRLESVAINPESAWLQQIAVVRDSDDATLASWVNEKLAEIKEEFTATARAINARAVDVGTDPDYDETWGTSQPARSGSSRR